ncbi:MAG: hypothetical protein O2809_11170 [Proteobacteria bacterium]|nr:hypothetical protein [Pseudomonadota bacterium]
MNKPKIEIIQDLLESGKLVTMDIAKSRDSDEVTRYEYVKVSDYYYPAAVLLIDGKEHTVRVAMIKNIVCENY